MAKKRKHGPGGPRPGSGRPALFDERVGVTVQMEGADHAALAEIAAVRGVSIGSLIRSAIRAHLARQRQR